MLQARSEQYQPIGYLKEPHGLDGDLIAELDINSPDLLNNLDLIWVTNSDAMLIPLRLESIEVNEQTQHQFFVHFVNIDNRQKAISLKGKKLFVEDKVFEVISESHQQTLFGLIGYKVIDKKAGIKGTLTDIMENPAHDILVLDNQMLIPCVDEYIIEIDHDQEIVFGRDFEYLKDL